MPTSSPTQALGHHLERRTSSGEDSDSLPPPPNSHPQNSTEHSGNHPSGAVGGAEGWGAVEEDAKKKRTRNRKPSSCVQCRRKKLRCNRGAPCSACTAKGEGDLCSWDDATPLFNSRAVHDASELRAQVARLEDLVKFLTAQPSDQQPLTPDLLNSVNDYFSSNRSASRGNSPPLPVFQAFPSRTGAPGPSHIRQKSEELVDLRANDLCEALSQLAIREFVVLEGSGGEAWSPCGGDKGTGTEFIAEAKTFLDTMPQRFGLTFALPQFEGSSFSGSSSDAGDSHAFSPAPLGVSVFHRGAPPISDLLQFLPTEQEALSAYTYYSGYVSWYSHPVHLATFEAQWVQLKDALKLDGAERDKAIDPFFVATFLGVLAMGLSMMPAKRALRDGFSGDKDKKVDFWLEGAMTALTCGRFLDNPSVESVRAVVVISTYFVFMAPGESSGAGMGLLSLSVQVAMSLSLHRDPDKTPEKFTFFEAEERRRLFWSLFMLCILSSASLGRTWAVFDLNNVDCKLPLDCHDHEIINESAAKSGTEARRRQSEETPMTSLLVKMKLAVMAKKINDRAFGVRPVSYATVLELDQELIQFEESIPSRYQLRLDSLGAVVRPTAHVTVTEMRACMVQISVASEFIRIHRPWLVRAGKDPAYQYSRDQAIKYSKLLLAVYRTPSCNKQRWGGLTYKATNAATVLAIEIIAFPDGSEVDAHRACIRAAAIQMETFTFESSLCRKGARLLRFLLNKEAGMVAIREQQRAAKRSRRPATSTAGQNLRQVFNAPAYDSPPLTNQPLFDYGESYHHKTTASHHDLMQTALNSSALSQTRAQPRPLPRSQSSSISSSYSMSASMTSNAGSSGASSVYAPPIAGMSSGQVSRASPAVFAGMGSQEWPFDFTLPPAPVPSYSPIQAHRTSYEEVKTHPPAHLQTSYYQHDQTRNYALPQDIHVSPASEYINPSHLLTPDPSSGGSSPAIHYQKDSTGYPTYY